MTVGLVDSMCVLDTPSIDDVADGIYYLKKKKKNAHGKQVGLLLPAGYRRRCRFTSVDGGNPRAPAFLPVHTYSFCE